MDLLPDLSGPSGVRLGPQPLLALVWLAIACSLLASPARLTGQTFLKSAPPGTVETGSPSFTVFGPGAIGADSAPTDLHLLPDGRVLVAAQREIITGDGVRWETVRQAPGDQRYIIQSVAIGEHGSLYAGVPDGFARIDFESDGKWKFTQASPMPPSQGQQWPEFQVAEKVGAQWYWHSNSGAVIAWNPGTAPRVLGSVNTIGRIFNTAGHVFVSDYADGALYQLQDSRIEVVVPPEKTDLNAAMVCAVDYGAHSALVGTIGDGIQVFDGRHAHPFVQSGLLAGGHRINDLCATYGGFYAAAVDTVGIVFFDRHGRIVQVLDRSLDHRLGRVLRLVYAENGVLWALLNDGIARIEFPSRISHFESLIPTNLSYVEPQRLNGKLWLLAGGRVLRGLYSPRMRLEGFQDDSPPDPLIFALSSVDGNLIASTRKGFYRHTSSGWLRVIDGIVDGRIAGWMPDHRRSVYVARGEVGWLDLGKNPVEIHRIPVPSQGDPYGTVQDKDGAIWYELGTGKIGRLDPAHEPLQPEIFDASKGIPDSWASLYLIDGKVELNCANRVLGYDPASGRFTDDKALIRRYPFLASSAGRPAEDSLGRLWTAGTDHVRIIDIAPGSRRPVEYLPPEFRPTNFFCEDHGVVWMHDSRRFARYDPSMPQPPASPVHVVITRVDLPESDRTLFSPGVSLPSLGYADNSLSIHFLAPGNPQGQQVNFEFMLQGLGRDWVPNGTAGSVAFTRLREGHYVFRVRPRVGNLAGAESRLEFTIRPPWFRTPGAYAAYIVGGLSLLALAIFLPAYTERRHKARLEQLVHERTRELNETNQLLARQMVETLGKTAELRASEERFRHLSSELERRVGERTNELMQRVSEVERLASDLDRSAARLQEANANLLVANQELESFSYSVSHDRRAPLRNITGFIELLQRRLRGNTDKDADRYLDIVVGEAKRMAALIDDLLTFSRVGRAEMSLQPVDLAQLIEEARHELAHEAQGRDIQWRIQPLPPVLGDRTLLRQVIANLLSNALKFTRRRETAVIEIGAEPAQPASDLITFYVRDNGAGFNPQYADKLFRVFQRLHNIRDFEGTGVGLANVKRIVTRHGGSVWAAGKVDNGATFYFTLKPSRPAP